MIHTEVFHLQRLPDHRFAPLGRCLYCPNTATDGALTDEHIIPDGLNGHLVLPNASCSICQKHINKFETETMRRALALGRGRLSIRSRKGLRRKEPKPYASGDGQERHPISADMPALIAAAHYNRRAELLTGEVGDDKAAVSLGWAGIIGRSPIVRCRPADFTRLVAKIAHAYAIAGLGYDTFKPVLVDHIMSDGDPGIPMFLGITSERTSGADYLHKIALDIRDCDAYWLPKLPSRARLAVVSLQLFAHTFNLPTYEVVAGVMND